MPDLSLLYCRRNWGRLALMALVIALGVAGTLVLTSVFASFGQTRALIWSGNDYLVQLTYHRADADPGPVRDLAGPGTRIITGRAFNLSYPLFGVAVAGAVGYALSADDMASLLDHLGLADPAPGLAGLLLPEAQALALGVSAGDELVESNFRGGLYPVAGIIRGHPQVIVLPLELAPPSSWEVVLALPPAGEVLEVEARLAAAAAGLPGRPSVWGPAAARTAARADYREYLAIALALSLLVASTVSLTGSLLRRSDYHARRGEMTILAVIGYPRAWLIRRAGLELSLEMLPGWLVGTALGVAGVRVLDCLLYRPQGMVVRADLGVILPALMVPVVPIAVSLLTVARIIRGDILRGLDPSAAPGRPG